MIRLVTIVALAAVIASGMGVSWWVGAILAASALLVVEGLDDRDG